MTKVKNDLAQSYESLAAEKEKVQTLMVKNEQLQTSLRELEHKLKATPPPAPPAPRDALREQLTPELALLKAVHADAALAKVWLHTDKVDTENEARQLVRLLAVMGDWGELQTLWKYLSNRCKEEKRPATANEHVVLQAALTLHNLRYRNCAALLTQVELGSAYHHETMERGTSKGSAVLAVWLPGLLNAAGHLQNHTLVQTSQ